MRTGHAARKFRRSALLGFLLVAQLAVPAHAAQVTIATAPLFNAAISLVKPNLLFLFDDSTSMAYNYLPDEVPWDIVTLSNPNPQTDSHTVALTSSQCSGVAYDPTITYTAPIDSSGAAFINASGTSQNANYPSVTFTSAPVDGFNLNSPKVNLNTTGPVANTPQVYYKYLGALVAGVRVKQPKLSYTYSNGVVDTTTTFYTECNSVASNAPAFQKVTVNATSGPGNTDERQNYARWFSYYRTRMLMMKTLVGQSFQTLSSNYRVGFSTIHDKGADNSNTFLPINDFTTGAGNQKDNFYSKIYAITVSATTEPVQFTPTRGALAKAGRLFAGSFYQGVGDATDKLRDPMQYSCQQNFTLLASDGYWNSPDDFQNAGNASQNFGPYGLDNVTPVGNQDGAGTSPPFFEGNYPSGATAPNTLADVSMYYYKTDLRFSGNFNAASCTSGSTGANLCPCTKDTNGVCVTYAPNVPTTLIDDNPKPHMTTMTVGLGINGLLGYRADYLTAQTGDYFLIKGGNLNWPHPSTSSAYPFVADSRNQVIERVDDLWHTAVNGRGTYFNARDPTTLVNALKGALGGVANRLGYGNTGATSSLAPISGNNSLFVASYITGQWTGNMVAQTIDTVTGVVNTGLSWCVEDDPDAGCSGQLEGQAGSNFASRNIYFNSGSLAPGNALPLFQWTNLTATQKAYFNPNQLSQWALGWSGTQQTTYLGDTLVNYLRGESQYEIGNTQNLYRRRVAKLGDIVDSQPIFIGAPFYQYSDPGYTAFKAAKAGRAKIVLAASNDGMLHAFDATNGQERWAFIPNAVLSKLYWLADTSYSTNHHNYVNGRLVWSDVCFASCSDADNADWHTILMGGMNGGARGYYALDVTDTANPKFLWEFTAANDPDVGYSFGNPLAMKKSDGTWVVVVASGYDNGTKDSDGSTYAAALQGSGTAALFVLNPRTGVPLGSNYGKYRTCTSSGCAGTAAAPNGLAKMSFWADNPEQNPTALNAYGGDLDGNLWRFDINLSYSTANGSVVKMAALTNDQSQTQPITTRPEMTVLGSNRLIFVATGKYLEASDLTNTQIQSLYALVDRGASTVADRSTLAKRTFVDHLDTLTRTITDNGGNPASGWFVDFPDMGTGGGSERANVDMVLAVGTLVVPTNVPTDEICNASGFSWINYLDYRTGLPVGGVSTSSVGTKFANDLTTGINAIWIGGTPEIIRTGNASGPAQVTGIQFGGVTAGVVGHRVGWREIFVK